MGMKWMDVVRPQLIVVDMKAKDKEDAFCELADALVQSGVIGDREKFLNDIRKRETLGSTGIGRGIAVPHTKTFPLERPQMVVGISRDGIDWASLDGGLVHVVFLLLSPQGRPMDHLVMLELVNRSIRDDCFTRFLRQMKTADEVMELLQEMDNDGL